ncbi:MAG: division/cell wall cluster transcriptional repressor MraZ, partial [Oscillospiraceae bacterium]
GERFYVTRWQEDCLAVFSAEEFTALYNKIKQLPIGRTRDVQLYLFSKAAEVETDKQGRILIPANLREAAKITKDVAVIGVMSRAEIWDRERWQKKSESLQSEMFDETLLELGI